MGLDCRLEDEFGEELGSYDDAEGLLLDTIPAGRAEFPLLRYLDPEGGTSFNKLQLEAALPELERLSAEPGPAGAAWKRVLSLARRGAAEPHLHLRFLGD